VALKAQPATDTTVNIAPMPSGIMVSPSSITFLGQGSATPGAVPYSSAQLVTVASLPDEDLKTDPYSIRVTAPGLGVTDQFVSVTVIDDDLQKIILTDCAGNTKDDEPYDVGQITEGTTRQMSFCARLGYQPLSNTVVDLALNGGTSMVSLDRASLTFTTSDYSVPQPVAITVKSDRDAASDSDRRITLSSSGFAATRAVKFNTFDGDNLALMFSHGGTISLDAGGDPGTLQMWLSGDPITPTTVICSPPATPPNVSSPVMFSDPSSATYIFGSGNYGDPQNINLSLSSAASRSTDITITCKVTGQTPTPLPGMSLKGTFTIHVNP